MTYEEAKIHKAALEEASDTASLVLKAYPKTGPFGLVPEEIRMSPLYRQQKATFDRAFAELRKFNQFFVKKFKKEYAAERKARRG